MNIGFPDVCLTPAVPSPIPIPYPNMAMNAQAVPFVVKVMVRMMNVLSMGSKIPMTSGDEGGVSHPLFKQMGAYTLGNPRILSECLPTVTLAMPTTGNMMNNPLGMVSVPSVVHVFLSLREDAAQGDDAVAADGPLVQQPTRGPSALTKHSGVTARLLPGDIWLCEVAMVGRDLPAQVHSLLSELAAPPKAMLFDLRGNPGGEVMASIELARDCLPLGTEVAMLVDDDGDETRYRVWREPHYTQPLVCLVDGMTASAAELLVASLQANGRAVVVGERSYGKTSVQSAAAIDDDARMRYAACARWRVPGEATEGVIVPDVEVAPSEDDVRGELSRDTQLRAALREARRLI